MNPCQVVAYLIAAYLLIFAVMWTLGGVEVGYD